MQRGSERRFIYKISKQDEDLKNYNEVAKGTKIACNSAATNASIKKGAIHEDESSQKS